MDSSPPPRMSHRFDGHLPKARNTVVHPIVTPFGRHHAQPHKAPVTVAAWGRMRCVLQARRIARYEYIPPPDIHLLRPSASLLRLITKAPPNHHRLTIAGLSRSTAKRLSHDPKRASRPNLYAFLHRAEEAAAPVPVLSHDGVIKNGSSLEACEGFW